MACEHGPHIAGRTGDHLQDVGWSRSDCSSDSVRSRVFACTSSNSRDIADGDHRLIGEGLQQGDLLVAERMRLPCGEALNAPMLSPSRSNGTSR